MKRYLLILYFFLCDSSVFAAYNKVTFEGVIVEGQCKTSNNEHSVLFSCFKGNSVSNSNITINAGQRSEMGSGSVAFSYLNIKKNVMMATVDYL